jgi:hypothetical protein
MHILTPDNTTILKFDRSSNHPALYLEASVNAPLVQGLGRYRYSGVDDPERGIKDDNECLDTWKMPDLLQLFLRYRAVGPFRPVAQS